MARELVQTGHCYCNHCAASPCSVVYPHSDWDTYGCQHCYHLQNGAYGRIKIVQASRLWKSKVPPYTKHEIELKKLINVGFWCFLVGCFCLLDVECLGYAWVKFSTFLLNHNSQKLKISFLVKAETRSCGFKNKKIGAVVGNLRKPLRQTWS